MTMDSRWRTFAPMALAVGLALPGAPQAATCQQAKLGAAGKATAGAVHCHAVAAKAATSADPACLDKAAAKLAETFAKADAKGACPTPDDAPGVQSAVDVCVGLVRATLGAVSPPPAPSPCLQAKLDAAGKSASARLKCWAKAAAKATAVDPACLSKEQTKLLAAFVKAEAKAACVQTGDASLAEVTVSTCVGDVLGLLPPFATTSTTTTTTSTSTTTTTLSGACSGSEPPALAGITALHNGVRASASPTPVPPLAPLCWSAAPASVAQAWADTCTWAHNAGRGDLGENLYASVGGGSPTDAVTAWAAEAVDYTYATNTCSGGCGHYTQLVWRNTEAVGCGTRACSTGSPFGSSFPNWTIVVCNYDPPGNYIGQWPY